MPARFKVAPASERTLDGTVFASRMEMLRYAELRLLARAKVITRLELQPSWEIEINGKLLCRYTADFAYRNERGELVIEDVKSGGTAKDAAYRLRKKAFELAYNLPVTEVIRGK